MSLYGLLHSLWESAPVGIKQLFRKSSAFTRAKAWFRTHVATHDDLYTPAFYEGVDQEARRSAGPIADTIVRELRPARILDVGCGTGALLAALRERGVGGNGLEYSDAGLEYCRNRQLDVQRFDLEADVAPAIDPRYDVVVSMEVAEHLPERLADRFVDLIAQRAPTVVFTAAVPGQGGVDHVNEQPHDYWIEKFAARGLRHDRAASQRWQEDWKARDVAWFYHSNLMLFRRDPG